MKKEDLNFTIYCVGIVAESLGRDARDVYRLMQQGNIIMGVYCAMLRRVTFFLS